MRKSNRFIRLVALLLFTATAGPSASTTLGISTAGLPLHKLDSALQGRAWLLTGRSRVIVQGAQGIPAASVTTLIHMAGGSAGRALPSIGGRVGELPHPALSGLATDPAIDPFSTD